jgi:hypothetical protein
MAFIGNGAQLTSLEAGDIASGTVATARLASGTANSSTFLRGDQTWASLTIPEANNKQVFTSSGTFNVPAGVSRVKVTVIGAGGNGGNGSGDYPGGGGGAGGYVVDYVAVTAGGTATVTVGTSAGTRTSSFVGGTTITASGGSNGTNGSGSNFGFFGLSASASVFGQTYSTPGAYKENANIISGMGSIATSGTTSYLNSWGCVYNHGYGIAGGGRRDASNTYLPIGYGAGGGGGGAPNPGQPTGGGAGANGVVIVEW